MTNPSGIPSSYYRKKSDLSKKKFHLTENDIYKARVHAVFLEDVVNNQHLHFRQSFLSKDKKLRHEVFIYNISTTSWVQVKVSQTDWYVFLSLPEKTTEAVSKYSQMVKDSGSKPVSFVVEFWKP